MSELPPISAFVARIEALQAENVSLKAVAKAARRYFVGYAQDEAADSECCITEEQHEDAKALEKALADLEMIEGN